jgi:hypothetical protein
VRRAQLARVRRGRMDEQGAAGDAARGGTHEVGALLVAVSGVLQALVRGLALRVDGGGAGETGWDWRSHELRRLAVLAQVRPRFFDGSEDAAAVAAAPAPGPGPGPAPAPAAPSDDESTDADSFKRAFDTYTQVLARLGELISASQGGAEASSEPAALPEELERLHALRREAAAKNAKIKFLIDRLRQLRQNLSALDSR